MCFLNFIFFKEIDPSKIYTQNDINHLLKALNKKNATIRKLADLLNAE